MLSLIHISEKFCSDPEHSNWESATITTLDDKIPQYIQKICKRDPFSGRTCLLYTSRCV